MTVGDKQWAGVDEIPGVGTVTWAVRVVDDGDGLRLEFDHAHLAGGELTEEQLAHVKGYLREPK